MAGYIKVNREELDSEIWRMPPLYHRVWQYLSFKVNSKHAEITLKDGTPFKLTPGQHLTKIRDIAKGVGWQERGKFFEPNPKTISTILNWLKEQKMIDFEAVTSNSLGVSGGNSFGTLITLINRGFSSETADESNSISAPVTCYQGSEQESTTITLRDICAHDSMNPTHEEPESRTIDPFIQVLDAYCDLHSCLDLRVKTTERAAIGKLIAGSVPPQFIIDAMHKIYEKKRQNALKMQLPFQQPTSFLYYDNAIQEAWRNANTVTDFPKRSLLPQNTPQKRKPYRTRHEQTNDFLKKAFRQEEENDLERGSSAVRHHPQFLFQLRGG
ncbi:hypothetical protein [Paenibacillus chitinolyticus]|uniref:hypothetical protein n=1 Tax=Paenibacillus chitinolyticus TaxID=79263 RepID=UPI003661C6E1